MGHHIGGHLTDDVRCDIFLFEDGEYISEFRVSSGDLVDRIEISTNTGRTFQAGGPGGSLLQARTNGPARVVALGGGLGGHMHNVRAFYLPL